MKKGLLISIEGLDGSGKTTQIEMLKKHLENLGEKVIVLREPGGTNIGEQIRTILLDHKNTEMNDVAEMFLYAASRAQLFSQIIKPNLESGIIVICDRFIDSSIVYQGYGRGLDVDDVIKANLTAIQNRLPDITLFIDINAMTSLERRMNASKADRLEREAIQFHERVYEGYIKLSKIFKDRIIIINGEGKIKDISNQMIKEVDNLLKRRNIWNLYLP